MSEFLCGSYKYRAGQLDARTQFHIVRRLAPVLGNLAPAIAKAKAGAKMTDEEAMEEALPGISLALASMDDDTADYIIFGLLSCVSREQGQGLGWAPVSTGRSLMFQDLTMAQMVTLAGRALMVNLGDFFAVLNSLSARADQKPKGP